MELKILEIEAREILQTYTGANNQILEWQYKYNNAKGFKLARTQAIYIVANHQKVPKVARKWVEVVASFGETLASQRNSLVPIKKIWIEKLLTDTDKAYHIWGKITENDKLSAMWVPKAAILQEEKKLNRIIDYSPYKMRLPMDHQKIAIEKLLANDRYILADDMGLGKTTSAVIASLESNVKKVLIVCPASLKLNWKKEIEIYTGTDKKILIVEGRKWGSTFDYYIINYDILKNYHTTDKSEDSEAYKLIVNEKFDLAIVDECFTYDSKIMTEYGEMNIGDVVENSLNVKILTYNQNTHKIEYNNIARWIKKHKDTIYQIKLSNGVFIECTDNHKFYTNNRGYVKARELTIDDDLFLLSETTNKETNNKKKQILLEELCVDNHKQKQDKENFRKKLSQKMPKLWKINVFHNKKIYGRKNLLFGKLFFKNEGQQSKYTRENEINQIKNESFGNNEKCTQKQSTFSQDVIRKNEEKQSNVQSIIFRKNEKKINGTNIFIKGWARTINRAAKTAFKITRGGMGARAASNNKKCTTSIQEFTKRISGGYWGQGKENINRNRWTDSQIKEMEVFRQKKNRSIEFVRMESIKILERGSYDQSANVRSKNTRVYDLEIENNHNYFINNILVSNCHYLANSSAQRTKLMNDILEKIPKVWLLTGTPMTSRPINYFNLLKIVNSPVTLNWQQYVKRYCRGFKFKVGRTPTSEGRTVWNTSGASNLDELRERVKNLVLRRMKTDILDLPEKIITQIYLELDSSFYDEELAEFLKISESEKGNESIAITLTRLMKVRQIIAIEKVPYTCELIDKFLEQDKKVIVFTNFTMSLDMIHEKYPKNSVVLDGRMTKEKKDQSVTKFQNDKKIKVFIANIKAGGVGINLTEAEGIIMNDLSFVPSDHSQAEDRAYRIGQKNSVLVYYPIFENTIEQIVYNILQRKKDIIDQVMGDGEYSESFSKELLKELL